MLHFCSTAPAGAWVYGVLTQAATIVHQGDMTDADRSMQTLARWIEDNGYRSHGYAREVTLQFDPDHPANWVHEFQIQVTKPD